MSRRCNAAIASPCVLIKQPEAWQVAAFAEHGWDPKGPPTLIDLQVGLDADGSVAAWHSQFYLPDGAAGTVPLVAANLADLPADHGMSPGLILNDSAIPYAFPNVLTVAHRLADTPLRPSWIRTPGRMQNTFANEAFFDELALAAKRRSVRLPAALSARSARRRAAASAAHVREVARSFGAEGE